MLYLILNLLIIIGAIYGFALVDWKGGIPLWTALFIGIALYAVTLVIAASPVGEWILRIRSGCRRIRDTEQLAIITPIFDEVYAEAKELEPSMPNGVKLFVSKDSSLNAYAAVRKTICITNGLLNAPKWQIKAALSHEFGQPCSS